MTYADHVLRYLKSGKRISPLIALRKWGCFRLADVIFKLRRMGHNIQCDLVKRGNKRFGEYRMVK